MIEQWIGYELDAGPGEMACERSAILHWCEAVEDHNPLYWDHRVADALTGGWIAPPAMLSVWMRPLMSKPAGWDPLTDTVEPGTADDHPAIRPLEAHFRLKDALGLPEGIVAYNEMELHAPVRPGDRCWTRQTITDISEERTNRLGTGRFWTIEVTYTNQDGELVGKERYRMFGYRREEAQ